MLKALITTLSLILSFSAQANDRVENDSEPSQSCKDVKFQLLDDAGDVNGSIVNVVMDCHDAQGSWPEQTTINIISFNAKQGMCASTITCGNVNAWMVDFQVGGIWEYGSLRDFGTFHSGNSLNGEGVKAVIQLNKKNIDRYCTEKTKRTCI
jgi:hypothetical protein